MSDALDALRALAASGDRGVHVTPLDGAASTVLALDGDVLAGPEPPVPVRDAAADVVASGTPLVVEDGDDGWFIEPVLPPPRLIVLGAIAVADALVPMAAAAGFAVEVVDPRPWLATAERYPDAVAVHHGDPIAIFDDLVVDAGTAVVSFLHEERLEDPVLGSALSGPAGYVGAMGSRRTTALKRERLRASGVPEDAVARLHAPIGLNIAAVSPQEIAVAVLGEIVAVRRGAP